MTKPISVTFFGCPSCEDGSSLPVLHLPENLENLRPTVPWPKDASINCFWTKKKDLIELAIYQQ